MVIPPMSLPSELQALIDEVDRLEDEARRLIEGLDDRQVNLQPPGGGWSVAQCLDHLARMNVHYVGKVLPAARAAQGRGPFEGLHPGWFARRFIRYLEPPVGMKSKTAAEAEPRPELSGPAAVQAYVDSHEPYRELVALAAQTNPDRVIVPNPLISRVRMKVSSILLIVPAHDRRHLWQAREVLRKLEVGSGK